jgi:hypothetical protein
MIDKHKILDSIRRMPDDASLDEVLDRLRVLQKIERGLQDIEAGRVSDFDEALDELLNEDSDGQAASDRNSKKGSTRNTGVHRKGRASGGKVVHQKIKSRSK